MAKYVKLNPSAHIFFDQASKIKVTSGEVVELTDRQYNLRVIQAALRNGYLKDATQAESKEVSNEKPKIKGNINLGELQRKFEDLVDDGEEVNKIKDKFKIEELKALAESYDIMPEDGDTKTTLVEAIIDELNSRYEEEDK